MYTGYTNKIQDSWTDSIYYWPRWIHSNGYTNIGTELLPPPIENYVSHTSMVLPVSGQIPISWVLTNNTPASSVFLLQRFFEAFANERAYYLPTITTLGLAQNCMFDTEELSYVWLAKYDKTVQTVEVQLSDGSWYTVQPQNDSLSLLYGPNWGWSQSDTKVVLSNLDLQQNSTESRYDNWQYIKYQELYDQYSVSYYEHPDTKNWIPLRPIDVRSDGFINVYTSTNLRIRSKNTTAAQALSYVNIRLNGNFYTTANKVDLWTQVDNKGLWNDLHRRPGESNASFGNAILLTSYFGGQDYAGATNYISAALRLGSVTQVAGNSGSFSVPASATGYSVLNFLNQKTFTETLTNDIRSTNGYISRAKTPALSAAFLNGTYTGYTLSGGVYYFNAASNRTDQVKANWLLTYWTQSGSTVSFTANMPQQVTLTVYFPAHVAVIPPTQLDLRLSFLNTSPIYKWRSMIDSAELQENTYIGGGSTFV